MEQEATAAWSQALGFGELDAAQQQAVEAPANVPLCIQAGAGAGKTRVLTRRIAHRISTGGVAANHVVGLTFTRKAAQELRQRLYSLGIQDVSALTVGTFHAVALTQLRAYWLEANKAAPVVASWPERLVEVALQNLALERSVPARLVLTELAWAKSHGLDPDRYGEQMDSSERRTAIAPAQFLRIYKAYELVKRRRGVVDFDDLIMQFRLALSTDSRFRQAQQWKFRHFFVDEFQDLNAAQFELLQAWMGPSAELCVVGDARQAIYGWNGADADYFTNFSKYFPSARTLTLTSNYRSTPQILAAAAAVLPESASQHKAAVENAETDGPLPTVTEYVDERHEAVGIARRLRRLHSSGLRWSDMAVLVRTNAQRSPIEQALSEYGIPYRSGTGAGWLYDPAIADAMKMLRQSQGPAAQGLADAMEMFGDPEELHGAMKLLVDSLRTFCADEPGSSVGDYLVWLDVSSRHDGPDAGDSAVAVTTFHRAKGLEWTAVFLAGLEAGLVPYGTTSAKSGDENDEERRLFYVALTRAMRELHCSWAMHRSVKNKPTDRIPSPWLALVQSTFASSAPPVTPATVAHRVLENQRTLLINAGADTVSSATLDEKRNRLDQWRANRARMNGVAPQLILSDRAVSELLQLDEISLDSMAEMDDIGPIRVKSIGAELVALLQASTADMK